MTLDTMRMDICRCMVLDDNNIKPFPYDSTSIAVTFDSIYFLLLVAKMRGINFDYIYMYGYSRSMKNHSQLMN